MNSGGLSKQIITNIESREQFMTLLTINPGLIIIKLGATWCRPCKTIAPIMEAFFGSSPPSVMCADIDVDDCFDLYSFFKKHRITNGIPVILLYRKGNLTHIPDDSITGANPADLDMFFKRCGLHLLQLQQLAKKK